jgi:amino acid adenylation domain-containing protein
MLTLENSIGKLHKKQRKQIIRLLELPWNIKNIDLQENNIIYLIPRDNFTSCLSKKYKICELLPDFIEVTRVSTKNHNINSYIISSLLISLLNYSLESKIGVHYIDTDGAYLFECNNENNMVFNTLKANIEKQFSINKKENIDHVLANNTLSYNIILTTNSIVFTEKFQALRDGLIIVYFDDKCNNLPITFLYDSSFYNYPIIEGLFFNFRSILEKTITNIELVKETTNFIPKQHELQILQWSEAESIKCTEDTLYELIQKSIQLNFDKVALKQDDGKELNYADLDILTKQYAVELKKRVNPNEAVAVYLEKSFELIIVILAIHSIGAVYVPVDIKQPASRLMYIMNDTKTKFVITKDPYAKSYLKNIHVLINIPSLISQKKINIIKNSFIGPKLCDLAYIIYTSGTTGNPKGVKISHRAAAGFIQEIIKKFSITCQDRILQFASISFDMSIFEIFAALSSGAILYLVNDEEKMYPEKINSFVKKHQITLADIPPVLLPLLDPSYFTSVRLLSVGSEKFLTSILVPWEHEDRRIINGYGPTEACVMMCLYEYKGNLNISPPIGKPICNTQAYVLNEHYQLLPIGAIGELHIGGDCLADGYVDDQKLTDERFITILINGKKKRVYKTGDYVRWCSDGNLEIFDRKDRQVKIRGNRIELGEIETIILSHPDTKQVIVHCIEDQNQNKTLIAFLIFHKLSTITTRDIQFFLENKLPNYMVPSKFIAVDIIPCDKNGKLDFEKLNTIFNEHSLNEKKSESNPVSIHDKTELLSIISNFLQAKDLKLDDNMFHFGFDCNISTADFYKSPSLRTLLHLTTHHKNANISNKMRVTKLTHHLHNLWLISNNYTNQSPVNMVFFHCAGGSSIFNKQWSFDLNTKIINFISIQLPGHDTRLDEKPLANIPTIAFYLAEEIKYLFNKPVIFVGHSMGALLAYETAVILQQQNKIISHMIVVASRAPNIREQHIQDCFNSNVNLENHMQAYGGLAKDFFDSPEFIGKFLPSIKADAKAAIDYFKECSINNVLHSPITTIFGSNDKTLTKNEITGWKDFTLSDFIIYSLPAEHFIMFDAKYDFIKILDQIAVNCLDPVPG